jgi:hypothetical protein
MAKVPRGLEPNNPPLAGLTNSSGGTYGPRVDHDAASSRSSNLGRFGRAFLWILGRRRRPPVDPNTEAEADTEAE